MVTCISDLQFPAAMQKFWRNPCLQLRAPNLSIRHQPHLRLRVPRCPQLAELFPYCRLTVRHRHRRQILIPEPERRLPGPFLNYDLNGFQPDPG